MKFKKITAVLTALCFLTAFTGQSFAQYAGQKKENFAVSDVNSDIFAEKYGKVTEVENYNSPQVIINIQDLHAHPQTQKNIAAILESLDKKYNLKKVYTEGASGKVDISWLAPYAKTELGRNIILQMVENGALTGSEYFAFLNNKSNLYGLEDVKIHHQNIVRLGTIYANEEANLHAAANIKNEISYLSNKNLNSEMKKLAKSAAAYHSNKMDAAKYYSILLGYADKINKNPLNYSNAFNIDPEEFTEMRKVVLINKASAKLNAKRINSQLQKYLAELKDNIPVSEYQELLNITDNLSDTDMFFKYIAARGFNAENNSDLAAFMKIKEMNSSVNPLELFAQEQKLEEQLRRALSSSELEREISFLNDFFVFFEGYLTNKLTAKDEEYLKRNFNTFAALYKKYASVDYISEIGKQFDFLNEYYDVNNKRNEIFIDKINENDKLISGGAREAESAENILNNAKEIIVIVTGGYHTLGVNELLDSKKISHITVTPKISGSTAFADINYKQIIIEQSRIFREALAFVAASQAPDVQRFKNLVEAGAAFLGKEILFEDIGLLIGQIENIVGEEGTASLNRIDADNAEIIFANGAAISVSRGTDGGIIVNREISRAAVPEEISAAAVRISDKSIAEVYFSMAASLSKEAFKDLYAVAVLDVRNNAIYEIAKEFFILKVSEGADFGVDGAVPELEQYAQQQGREGVPLEQIKAALIIDGISYGQLSRMPEFFQRAVLARQIDKDLSEKTITPEKKSILSGILNAIKKMGLFALMLLILTACNASPGESKTTESSSPAIVAAQPSDGFEVQQPDRADIATVNYVAQAQVIDGKIIVTDREGRYIDYRMKGICYSVDQNSREFGRFYQQDLPLLKELGINSIRTYRAFAVYDGNRINVPETKKMLDAFQQAGITVTVGFSYEDMARGDIMDQYLNEFGDHPAILSIALGNEFNYHYGEWFSKSQWIARLTDAAARVKAAAPNKIVVVVHGEMPTAEEAREYKNAGIQLIMMNMYRGPGFTDAAAQWAALNTGMPFVLAEHGRSSKGSDGTTDTNDAQIEFITGQLNAITETDSMGYIFGFVDEPWKKGSIDNTVGSEADLGVYFANRKPKPVAEVVKQNYKNRPDGYYVNLVPTASESAPAVESATETQASGTVEKTIDITRTAMYGDQNWRAYSLYLGDISLDDQGELTVEIKTVDAAPNSGMKIELRNLDESGVPMLSSNIILPQTYKLAENGGSVTVRIPYAAISSLDFSKAIELVVSVGTVFDGAALNTKNATIEFISAQVSASAGLELPFFAGILNAVGITKEKYPKIRAGIISVLEAPLIMILSAKAFVKLHGKTSSRVENERLRAVDEMKRGNDLVNKALFTGAAVMASALAAAMLISIILSGFAITGFMTVTLPGIAAGLTVYITAALGVNLFSFIQSHYRWNLANPKDAIDSNIHINMIYATKENLNQMQAFFTRNIEISESGTVSQRVYILNEGINPASEGFSNSGINVNGSVVWVKSSAYDGIIYYAENAEHADISAAIQNKKLENKVRQSLKENKILLSRAMSADYLEVDTVSEKKPLSFDQKTANIKVYPGENFSFDAISAQTLDSFRDIRNAEAWQRARSIMVYLDKTTNISDFEKYIKILGKASNGNIIITEELAINLISQNKLDAVLEQLRQDGISIMVETNEKPDLPPTAAKLFDGKFNTATGRIESAVAGVGNISLEADMITEKEAETMETALRDSKNNIVIFETAIEKYVGDDRSGLGKFLEDITSVKILKYFAAAPITAESAKETARNFDIEKIMFDFPDITGSDIETLYRSLQNGETAETIFFSIPNLAKPDSGAVKYLTRINERSEDDGVDARPIKQAYMEGLAEKLAAAVEFKKAGRTYGFKNKNTEMLVGQLASFKYLPSDVSVEEASAVRTEVQNMTAKNYNNAISVMINDRPRAIPAVADDLLEMIFAYESRVKMDKKDFKMEPNLKAMEAILKAA